MPVIDENAVMTAATTAVIVTLLVEYFAKPRLEARKERILERMRVRRGLVTTIVNLAQMARGLSVEPTHDDQEVRERVQAEWKRQYGRVSELSQDLFDHSAMYAGVYQGRLPTLIGAYAERVRVVLLSNRPPHVQAGVVAGLSRQAAKVLSGPRWRRSKLRRYERELIRMLSETWWGPRTRSSPRSPDEWARVPDRAYLPARPRRRLVRRI